MVDFYCYCLFATVSVMSHLRPLAVKTNAYFKSLEGQGSGGGAGGGGAQERSEAV